jgi:hypothetical protein
VDGGFKIYFDLLRRKVAQHLTDFREQSSVAVLELVHQQAETQMYVMSIRRTVDGANLGEKHRTVVDSAIH